jgi:hypothetical protein
MHTLVKVALLAEFSCKSSLLLTSQKGLVVGVIDNFAFFGFNRETRSVQFETNAIYGFVPSSIYSRKKQMPVFKGELFIAI